MDIARAALQRLQILRDARALGVDPARLVALIGPDEMPAVDAAVDEVVVASMGAEESSDASGC